MAKGRFTGGGRRKGVPNKATREVKVLAGEYGPAAIKQLANLMKSAESEQARVSACKEILDRAYGKAPQTVNVNDVNDVRDLSTAEILRRLAAAGAAAAEAGDGEPDQVH